jgi:hypothetical protein
VSRARVRDPIAKGDHSNLLGRENSEIALDLLAEAAHRLVIKKAGLTAAGRYCVSGTLPGEPPDLLEILNRLVPIVEQLVV